MGTRARVPPMRTRFRCAVSLCLLLLSGCGSAQEAATPTFTDLPAKTTTRELQRVSLTVANRNPIHATAPTVQLHGTVERGATVLVSGKRTAVGADGRWSRSVEAKSGRTSVTVQASMRGYRDAIETTTIIGPGVRTPHQQAIAPTHTAAMRHVPLSRWARSAFKGGYLAGRDECSSSSVTFLAHLYRSPANPVSIAQAFGRVHSATPDPSLRDLAIQAAIQGCVEGFQMQGVL